MTHAPSAAPERLSDLPPVWSAALTSGFGAVIVVWILAWILHLPALDAPPSVGLPVLIAALAGATAWMLRTWPREAPIGLVIKVGAIAGLVAGVVNLLILGSFIVEQPATTAEMAESANQLRPDAAWIVLGSLVVSAVAGAIGGAISRALPAAAPTTTRFGWRARFAVVVVFVYLPLIAIGGAVTGTESGLAVPDSVTSYGAISVLFPLELMAEPRIFLEHSHRLFGTLAGLATLVLLVRVLAGESRGTAKVTAILLFALVCVQGVMGALRVSEASTGLAILHGVLGQLVFVTAGVLAAMLSAAWVNARPVADQAKAALKSRGVMLACIAALVIQLLLGAVGRHMEQMHAILTHAGWAFIATTLVIVAGAFAARTAKRDAEAPHSGVLKRLGLSMHAIVTFQFVIGWAALGLAWTGDHPEVPTAGELAAAAPIRPFEALVTTTHQATGALLLLAAVLAGAWSSRTAKAADPA